MFIETEYRRQNCASIAARLLRGSQTAKSLPQAAPTSI
jgi:hypothetical protein